jgi:hypothetical protein
MTSLPRTLARAGPTRHFAEHFAGAGGAKLAHLGVNALVRRYPRISRKSWVYYAPEFRTKKCNRFNALILVRNS